MISCQKVILSKYFSFFSFFVVQKTKEEESNHFVNFHGFGHLLRSVGI